MSNEGWISIHRKIQDNWVWSAEPVNKAQAWIDLIIMANHKDSVVAFDHKPKDVKRGQMITSIRKLAIKWGWSKDKVIDFLDDLEKENMIIKNTHYLSGKATLLTLVNYGNFQYLADSEPYSEQDTEKDTQQDSEQDSQPTQTIISNNANNANNERKTVMTPVGEKEIAFIDEEGNEWFKP